MLLSTISIENEVAKISFNGLIYEFAEKWTLKNHVAIKILILMYKGHCYFIIQNHGIKLFVILLVIILLICNITCNIPQFVILAVEIHKYCYSSITCFIIKYF